MKDKTRLEYLDAAKGLGILLVILGHIYAWNPNINRKIFLMNIRTPLRLKYKESDLRIY